MNYHFWHSNLIHLRAIEQKDLDADAQSVAEVDTEAERYQSEIPFPYSPNQIALNWIGFLIANRATIPSSGLPRT